MAEFYQTAQGFRQMPAAVAAADAATRERWVKDPDRVAQEAAAAEAARIEREFQARVAEAKQTGQPIPSRPVAPLTQAAIVAKDVALQQKLEAARLAAQTEAPTETPAAPAFPDEEE